MLAQLRQGHHRPAWVASGEGELERLVGMVKGRIQVSQRFGDHREVAMRHGDAFRHAKLGKALESNGPPALCFDVVPRPLMATHQKSSGQGRFVAARIVLELREQSVCFLQYRDRSSH